MMHAKLDLTDEEAEKLDALARIRGTSVEELLSVTVRGLLAGIPLTVARPTEEQRLRALAASGRFDLGPRDLSENHDGYLAEAFES